MSTLWISQFAATPLPERAAFVQDLVVAEFRAWLAMDETEDLPLDESYFELGLTSLGATDVKAQLEGQLGRRFESATLFNNPTVSHLVDFLCSEVLADFFASRPAQQDDTPGAAAAHQQATEGAGRQGAGAASQKQLVKELFGDLYGI